MMDKLKFALVLSGIFCGVLPGWADTPADPNIHLCYRSYGTYMMRICNFPRLSTNDCFGIVLGGSRLHHDHPLISGTLIVVEAMDYRYLPHWVADSRWQVIADHIQRAAPGSYLTVSLHGSWPAKAQLAISIDKDNFNKCVKSSSTAKVAEY